MDIKLGIDNDFLKESQKSDKTPPKKTNIKKYLGLPILIWFVFVLYAGSQSKILLYLLISVLAYTFIKILVFFSKKIKFLLNVVRYGDFDIHISTKIPKYLYNSLGQYLAYKKYRVVRKNADNWDKFAHVLITIWGETIKFLVDVHLYLVSKLVTLINKKSSRT